MANSPIKDQSPGKKNLDTNKKPEKHPVEKNLTNQKLRKEQAKSQPTDKQIDNATQDYKDESLY